MSRSLAIDVNPTNLLTIQTDGGRVVSGYLAPTPDPITNSLLGRNAFGVANAELLVDRNNSMQNLGSNGTTQQYGMARVQHTVIRDGQDIVLIYSNASNPPNDNGFNAITVRASIEYPAASFFPVTFRGLQDGVCSPGGYLVSDPIGIDVVAGQVLWERSYVSLTSAAQKFPTGRQPQSAGEYMMSTGTPNDLTAGGAGVNDSTPMFSATAIVGTPCTPRLPSLAVLGDSQSTHSITDPVVNVPLLNLSRTGDNVLSTAVISQRLRMALVPFATHCLHALGINDIQNGSPIVLATMQATYITRWANLVKRGLKVYQWTCTPKTLSGDGWTTLGGQTTVGAMAHAADEGVRIQWNDWLRAGAPVSYALAPLASSSKGGLVAGNTGHPLSGYFECADFVESSRNSGLWKPTFTPDGVHPAGNGNTAIFGALNTWAATLS